MNALLLQADYSPNINLHIRVSRSAENMGAAVTDAIRPFLTYQFAVSGLMVFIFVLFARPILRGGFNYAGVMEPFSRWSPVNYCNVDTPGYGNLHIQSDC